MSSNTVIRNKLLDDAAISVPFLMLFAGVTLVMVIIWPIYWVLTLLSFSIGLVSGFAFTEAIRQNCVRFARLLKVLGLLALISVGMLLYMQYHLPPLSCALMSFGSYTGYTMIVVCRRNAICKALFMGSCTS